MTQPDRISKGFILPDCLSSWNLWPRRINPHHQEVKQASSSWLRSFNAFSPSDQSAYDRGDFTLVASLCYPLANKEWLRATSDMMHVFFVFDTHSDVSGPIQVRSQGDIAMDALHRPEALRPEGEWVGGQIVQQFWQRTMACANKVSQERFIEAFQSYTDAVVQEATDRSTQYIRTVEEYYSVRRFTVGALPCFAMLQLDMDIPDEVLHHPIIAELEILAIDMIILSNDLASYNREQACGNDHHNMVTVVMHHLHKTVQEAVDWIADHHKGLELAFMEKYHQVPRWGGPVDRDVAQYIYGLANWVRGNDVWNYESQRYFGTEGAEVQRSRWVTLSPKKQMGKDEVYS